MSYTEQFSEVHALLATINPASYDAETNSGYVSLANYHFYLDTKRRLLGG